MRDYDIEHYLHFLKRPLMYLGKQEYLQTFLFAYDLAANRECIFLSEFYEHLEIKFNTKIPSQGFTKWLKTIAKKKNKEWFELFLQESYLVLAQISDKEGKLRFANLMRQNILKYINKANETIDFNWRKKWQHLKENVEVWKGINLTDEEIVLINDIYKEIWQLPSVNRNYNDFELTENIKTKLEKLKLLVENHSIFA